MYNIKGCSNLKCDLILNDEDTVLELERFAQLGGHGGVLRLANQHQTRVT